MSVYAIADLHGNLPEIPADAESILIGGDLCPDFGRSTEQRQRAWLDTEFRGWMHPACPDVEFIMTPGNHDYVFEHAFLVPDDLQWQVLIDAETTLRDGRRVWCTPWVPNLPRWAFYGDERKLNMRAEAIPEGIDILVTHGPPLKYGDFIPTSPRQQEKYGNYNGEHVGDSSLNRAIRRVSPEVTICGHIHEARGSYSMPDDFRHEKWHRIENVAAVDIMYDLVPNPWVAV